MSRSTSILSERVEKRYTSTTNQKHSTEATLDKKYGSNTEWCMLFSVVVTSKI